MIMVNLYIKDRLSIIQMLPQNGSIQDMLDVIEIVKKVRVEKEEKELLNLTEGKNGVFWDTTKDKGKEVEFKFEEIDLLKRLVKNLDDEKKVNMTNLDVCLKINSL